MCSGGHELSDSELKYQASLVLRLAHSLYEYLKSVAASLDEARPVG